MILVGDVLEKIKEIPDESVQCCVTSPPYWGLRDYGHAGQIGLEKTPELYVEKMVSVFREVKRVLKKDGVLWLNLGDSYAGNKDGNTNGSNGSVLQKDGVNTSTFRKQMPPNLKPKDLVGIPWRTAFALQADGWWLRQDIIWSKPNPMPESVTDRCTKAHEYIFLMTKSSRYYYDAQSIYEKAVTSEDSKAGHKFGGNKNNEANSMTCHSNRPGKKWDPIRKTLQPHGQTPQGKNVKRENGEQDPTYIVRNKRSVWSVTTAPFPGSHFATFPEEIPELCIKAGSRKGDTILDPFAGSGTTLEVAKRLEREFIGIELNERYVKDLIEPRLESINPLFA